MREGRDAWATRWGKGPGVGCGACSPALRRGQGARGGMGGGQTLNTNISPRSMATVSKSPSQMLGPYWSGRSVARGWAGGPGFGGRSGFPPGGGGWGGLGGRWSGRPGRRGVTVGRGRVGCGWPSGVPAEWGGGGVGSQQIAPEPSQDARFSYSEPGDPGAPSLEGHVPRW